MGGMGLVTSILEPISLVLREINITSLVSLDIVSNYLLCSRFRAKEMPTICVATGCSNQNDHAQGISLHVIPVFVGHRRQAKRRRKKWIDFVKQKRAISRREICGRAVAFLFNRMMGTSSI